jgi:hypothetical protein
MAQKRCPLHTTSIQPAGSDGIVRVVHVIPSGEVKQEADAPTTTKRPFPQIIRFQLSLRDNVRAVHEVPVVDVAAEVDPLATAQKIEPFHATSIHEADDGIVLAVHVAPSDEVAAAVVPLATAQKTEPFHAIPCQDCELGMVPVLHVIPSEL